MLPSQVIKAYNLPAGRSLENIAVATVQLGGSFNPQDIISYCDKHGYIHPQLYIEYVDGAKAEYTGANGADGEVGLDICMIVAIAQGCKHITFFCPNTEQGFADGIDAAANHPLSPVAITISWGAPISAWTAKGRSLMDAATQRAMAKNIPVFVASGDNGSRDGTSKPTTDFPSSSPWTVGCGGTRLVLNADDTRKTETSWSASYGHGATGGGFTNLYPEPEWQKGKGTPGARNVPDISGNADPVTGFEVIADGTEFQVGGTSAVAPMYGAIWALLVSRLGQKVPNWHDALYKNPVTVDVVGGNNQDYQCTVNYDLCTGLGVVDGEVLLATLAKINNLTVLPPVKANPPVVVPPNPVQKQSLWEKFKKFFGLRQPSVEPFAYNYLTRSARSYLQSHIQEG